MINFEKNGLIIRAKDVSWVNSHLWVPTAYKLNQSKIIVFFAGRNYQNESDTGYFVYDINLNKVVKISKKPVLSRGELGSFDDSAAIPSHVIKIGKKYLMYYVGWTQGKKVPFFSSIGLATSVNIYGPYKKIGKAPIIGKTNEDPFFVATCFVEKKNNLYEMYYTSNLGWKKKKKKAFPLYLIKRCTSRDGLNWKLNNSKIINFKNKDEVAITRPWIVEHKKQRIMFFSCKKKFYKIYTALENKKKNNWQRKLKISFSNNLNHKFDNKSQEYSSVVKIKNKYYMFYNGNDYGKEGIGIAISNEQR
tara:strand:- start:100 stop:1014 length:915 start_codon:yes stop_codon:yes gene_type:complete